ncbi:MAG: hypothetical protein IPO58_02050 [Betaproteobacteria bacterium]|nr:hypothetical protein [Betaproteobacteria bacterium]
MLTELIASITARFSGGRAHPLTHTWSTTRWIEQNARLDADERMQELLAQINAFNASPKINAASLSAFLVLDVCAHRCIRELTETYLAGNRAANKAVLKKLDDAARWIGATYELFYRAHKAGKPAIRKDSQLAQVLLGMFRYWNLQNRVRLFRYDNPVPALWQVTSNLFRYATAAGVHRLAVHAPHRDGKQATIEGEYANLLLLARLSSGSFTAQEIEHASVLLNECSDRLRLRADEPAHATFALDPDSLVGLVSAHGVKVTDRTLFLDPDPLFAHIKKRLADIAADDAGDALARKVRIAWLERLATHWAPDRKVVPRRAERQPADIPVALVPGLHNIHRELLAEMENAGEFWDTLIRSGRWRIVEASPLDCRIQFENESADQFPVGALISMRREGAADWQIGVVRRVKRFEGNRIELGVEMIAREVKAIRLWPDNIRDQIPRNGTQSPDSAALVALYLPSTGAIPPAPSRTLILRHSDYKAGLSVLHISGDSRLSLQLGAAIEIGRGWVWSPFAVEGKSARVGDPVADTTTQGMTARLPVGSGEAGRNR